MQPFDLKALIRYLAEGFGVGLAAYLIAGQRFTLREVLMIALTTAVILFILDQFSPGISPSARLGAGFGLGLQTALGAPGIGAGLGAAGLALEPFNDQTAVQEGQLRLYPAPYGPSQPLAQQMPVIDVPQPAPSSMQQIPATIQSGGNQPPSSGNGGVLLPPVSTIPTLPALTTHYNRDCACNCPCTTTCQPEDKCKITCPDGKPCNLDGCSIGVSGCPYKLIPGNYSHRVLLPGYNECVQPFNSEN